MDERMVQLCPFCGAQDLVWETTCFWDRNKQRYQMSCDQPDGERDPICGDCGEEVPFPLNIKLPKGAT